MSRSVVRASRAALAGLALAGSVSCATAQATIDSGLPPASGSQNPVLPPPSGSQNPALPPASGQRYAPGVGGRFGEQGRRPDDPSIVPQRRSELIGSLSPATAALADRPLDKLADIAPALRRCWTPPAMDGPRDGAMATVRLSLRRNGTIFGQPRISWETKPSDPALQARFSASVLDAFQACAPLRLSDGLGAAIAGRPFTIRFHGRAPSNERPI